MSLNLKEQLPEEQENTQHGQFLTFFLGKEVFGIETRYVIEIIGMQPIATLPEAPKHIKGIINLRGKIIPVIDVRLKFTEPAVAYNDRTCIIVIKIHEIFLGLIVDNVAEVITINDKDIEPSLNSVTGLKNNYLSGIGKIGNEIKLLLDCENFFNTDELENIK